MTEREIFIAYINNKIHTHEGYLQAKAYYLTSATPEEKRHYETYIKGITTVISKSYAKSYLHFKGSIKRYGLTEDEAIDLINKKNNVDAESFLNKFSTVEQESFLKDIYTKCEKVRWNKQSLKELAYSSEISYELLINLICYYIQEVLKKGKATANCVLRRIEGTAIFDAFINAKTITNYSELVWYVRFYGSNTERETFFITLKEIIGKFKNEKISIKKMAKLIARKYNIDEIDAESLIISYLNIENKRNKEQDKIERYQEVYNMFLTDTEESQIEAYLKEHNLSIEEFTKVYLPAFLKDIPDAEKRTKIEKKIIAKLSAKLTQERNYRRRLKDKLKKVPALESDILVAKRVITDLIHKDENLKSLIALLGTEKFYRIITIVEVYDPELYALYYAKTNRGVYSIKGETLSNLASWLINGIEDNGTKRPFNILDYFENVKIPLSALPSFLTNMNELERKTILDFVAKSKANLNPNQKEASEEENTIVKKYLISNDIPIYSETYNLALIKYRNGTLQENKNRI